MGGFVELKRIIARAAVATVVVTGLAVVPAVILASAAGNQAKQGDSKKTATCTLKISGMTCGGCAVAVKMAAKKVDGVADAIVSYENGRAEVTYDSSKTSPEKIAEAITKNSGFKAEIQQPTKK
jgi:copper chaperone CopZ